MKPFFITAILVQTCLTNFAQQVFYYKVLIASTTEKVNKVYVAYEIAGEKIIDSFLLAKKQVVLTKKILQPVAATIYTNLKQTGSQSVFLANNSVKAAITEKSINVQETKLQSDFLFLTENDRIRPTYFPLYGELSSKNDTAGLNKLAVIFDSLKKDDINKSYNYFTANKNSLLRLFAFNRYTTFFADYSKIEKDFNLLPAWAKNSPDGKNISSKIDGAKSAQINTAARKFIQLTSTGQSFNIEAFEGKYILIDFWASWCVPCRKEHPNLIKLYEQFKNKNFDIVSVSLDSDKNAWIEAIIKDKINWTNVSDLKGQQNEIAIKYGVQSVPANFLINPNGVIIEKNLSSEMLYEKLTTLLNK